MAVPPAFPVVFFDGACPFCNRWAWRFRSLDRSGLLRFSTLQGETARQLLPPELRPQGRPGTMVLWLPPAGVNGPRLLLRGQAALHALVLTRSWVASLARLLLSFPTSWGDRVYGLIERRRARVAGDSCPLPEKADLAVLLP